MSCRDKIKINFKNICAVILVVGGLSTSAFGQFSGAGREKVSINEGWKFYKYSSTEKTDSLIYDLRPEVKDNKDNIPADSKPTEAVKLDVKVNVLKPWVMPSGNQFIKDPAKRFIRPEGNPGENFQFVKKDFNDSDWENINLPHDWASKGPFYEGWETIIGGGMGRLPVQGVAWYRKMINIPQQDKGKTIYLDVDGAMSYAIVWLNGKLVGGWPYGYNSWRLDLTPYIIPGGENQLSIRIDNPTNSARWYPGAGIYRNVWLTKVNPVHVNQWGTFVTTKKVTSSSAIVNVKIDIKNNASTSKNLTILNEVYLLNKKGVRTGRPVLTLQQIDKALKPNSNETVESTFDVKNPKLWNPLPSTEQNLYIIVTSILSDKTPVDVYETNFGIRDIRFDGNKGVFVNDKPIYIKGVNQHHDLGALGAAFNVKAAKRQLDLLKEMGCNAIRMSHNPPAPELLELTDQMGFLVVNEIYDSWEMKKTPLDFHLIFPDWYEQDLRSFIRRDKNHPSIMLWSYGNEVGEQYTLEKGAELSKKLHAIVKDEDPTRPTTVSMNYSKPDMPFSAVADVINLNYQGEGIRDGLGYEGLKGITTPPLYNAFHAKFPDKVILSSENAATLSSRGEYLFPVTGNSSAPAKDGSGANPKTLQVSAYELYSVEFGSSADKVFAAKERHPFVAGGFVWTGWDYLGEPTPYYLSKSSYFGIIDLAGFKKDRFYQYQAHWRPELPMAHILPHWNWADRKGLVTPVHVFTSGDEAELFLNGKSLGKKKKGEFEYRIRWDDVVYVPGELKVVAYKAGKKWAESSVKTTDEASRISLTADVKSLKSDGKDLAFITVKVEDKNGFMVPQAKNHLKFEIEGPGEIVGTDNGDPADLTSFASLERKAFNGLCLIIVRGKSVGNGVVKIKASSSGLEKGEVSVKLAH